MNSMFTTTYLTHQYDVIAPYLVGKKILDFGCGDMALDHFLVKIQRSISITGCDVAPFFPKKHNRLVFRQYGGKKLPFSDHTFDTVFAYHVFHHTEDSYLSLKECVRVAKKRIIIIEPILRFRFEKIGFAFLDFVSNAWKKEQVPIPYHIHTMDWWMRHLRKVPVRITRFSNVSVLPTFLPIGITMLMVLDKKNV